VGSVIKFESETWSTWCMKSLLPLLLVLLAMFYGTPRQACMCSPASVPESTVASHSCCKRESKLEIDCMSSKPGICKRSTCCGMTGKFTGGVASSISILPEHQNPVVKVLLPSWLCKTTMPAPPERISQINRAPPRLTGMGTSKTYLYKQTFLI
jgi:hypothetical protein